MLNIKTMPPVESSSGHPRPLDELNKLAEYGLEIKKKK